MPRILIFLLIAITFIPAAGYQVDAGETPAAPSGLSLESAISSALADNPSMIAAKSRIEASSARIDQARSGMLPQVNFTQSFQRTTNPMWVLGSKLNQENIAQQDFAPDLLNDPDPLNNYAGQIWVTWPLFDSGQSWYGKKQANTDKTASEEGFERTRQETVYRTVEAYADLLLARKSLIVVEHAIETAQTHLKIIENRFKNGLVVKSDVLRTKVHMAELEQDHVAAQSRAATARAALNTMMGRQTGEEALPTDELKADAIAKTPLPEWIKTALTSRPDLKQITLQEKIAQLETKKSRAGHWPSLNVSGGYEVDSENFTSNFDDRANNYTVGANITVNLFSGLRTSARTRETVSLYNEIKARRQAMIQQIRLETEKAYYDLLSADSRVVSAKLSTTLAEEALRIVRNRYESGLLNIDSLLDAELALYRAGNNYCGALRDHVQGRAGLALAAGTLDEKFKAGK